MLLRPSTLLLLLISALSVLASLGSNIAFKAVSDDIKEPDFAGGYWFEEVDGSKATTSQDKNIQDAAKTGYQTAKAVASKVKTDKYKNGVKTPPIVVALFIPGHGTIVASSIKTGTNAQSSQTCKTITYKHRNYANCAEPNSVSIAVREKWIAGSAGGDIPKGSKMAIYGKPGKTEGFQKPCADGNEKGDGCQRFLSDHPNIQLVNPVQKSAVEFTV